MELPATPEELQRGATTASSTTMRLLSSLRILASACAIRRMPRVPSPELILAFRWASKKRAEPRQLSHKYLHYIAESSAITADFP